MYLQVFAVESFELHISLAVEPVEQLLTDRLPCRLQLMLANKVAVKEVEEEPEVTAVQIPLALLQQEVDDVEMAFIRIIHGEPERVKLHKEVCELTLGSLRSGRYNYAISHHETWEVFREPIERGQYAVTAAVDQVLSSYSQVFLCPVYVHLLSFNYKSNV